jgi:hypothetical protein
MNDTCTKTMYRGTMARGFIGVHFQDEEYQVEDIHGFVTGSGGLRVDADQSWPF